MWGQPGRREVRVPAALTYHVTLVHALPTSGAAGLELSGLGGSWEEGSAGTCCEAGTPVSWRPLVEAVDKQRHLPWGRRPPGPGLGWPLCPGCHG